MNYLSIDESNFKNGDKTVQLKGFGLGNWLLLEHFMFGIPGTEAQIRTAIEERYGQDKATTFWDKYYQVYMQEADIKHVHDLGINHLRIPISYKHFQGPDFEQSVAIREIDRIMPSLKKYGIWAILDLHSVPGGQNPDWHSDNSSGKDGFWSDPKAMGEMASLWGKIANYYKEEPAIGGYELVNEPCTFSESATSQMLNYFKECTKKIRQSDSKHIIFYSGNTYSRDFSMFTENIDEQSSYTFHLYPFLQMPDEIQTDDIIDKLEKSLHEDVTYNHLKNTLKKPIWCGETGYRLDKPESKDILDQFTALLDEKHIGWALWPLKDCGEMGMLHADKRGKWNRLCAEASDNWSLWSLFTQDSILSTKKEDNPYAYYQWLADETTKGWEVFRTRLKDIPFDRWLEAVNDFEFKNCQKEE